ncbi:MAG: UDP-N-acetylmuramoyl-L-alanyl-D-glutamate--2,6-diaminopimelate ligase [Chloroflexota bacterium]
MKKLSQLLAALPHYSLLAEPAIAPAQTDIHHITADSRQVGPGALFVAYRGVNVDGRRFIPEAIARNAAAIVCEAGFQPAQAPAGTAAHIVVPDGRQALAYLAAAWFDFPARQMTMIGITGTDGKTTTTNFLYHMLRADPTRKVSMINTVSAVIGNQVLETGLHTTTPDAPEVQRYLAQMVAAQTDTCLLEVTSHGLAQHRVTACEFDIAVVTNITHEHLDLHGSIEAYRAAKAALLESLATAAAKGIPKTAVLNCDDGSFDYLKPKLAARGVPWLGYSLTGHPEAGVTARAIAYRPDKTGFVLQGRRHTIELETWLVGDHNVSNCLAAAAVALEVLGISPEAVQQGVAALTGIPGRLERIDAGQPFLALVDFAHTPNALRRALTTARRLTAGRVIAVFGCAGLRDVDKRAMMGHITAELADVTIITAEDPRTEDLAAIMAETARAMLADGGREGETFERIPDRGRAIFRAVQMAGPGEVVIALGKGHEQSMCFGQTEYPWDDRQAMRSALRGEPLLTLPTAHRVGE